MQMKKSTFKMISRSLALLLLVSFPGIGRGQSIALNTNYSITSSTLSMPSSFSGVECGSSFAKTKFTGMKTQSNLDTITHDCNYSYNLSHVFIQERKYDLAYDTLKSFVQRCPTNQYAPAAFGDMSGAVQNGGNGPHPQCLASFQQWLLSALAWNTQSAQYFCADVETLAGTFGNGNDSSWYYGNSVTNMGLAVVQWLIQNPLCNNADLQELYVNSRGSQRETWTSTQDTSKIPLDTTLPSMHDLGLDSVLKYALLLGVHSSSNVPSSVLLDAMVQPNPATDHVSLTVTIGREAYVHVDLLDLLGRAVEGVQYESVLEPGRSSIPLRMDALPTGTYYIRVAATGGEVKMVKFVKER